MYSIYYIKDKIRHASTGMSPIVNNIGLTAYDLKQCCSRTVIKCDVFLHQLHISSNIQKLCNYINIKRQGL
jgi:hypothetical protein